MELDCSHAASSQKGVAGTLEHIEKPRRVGSSTSREPDVRSGGHGEMQAEGIMEIYNHHKREHDLRP